MAINFIGNFLLSFPLGSRRNFNTIPDGEGRVGEKGPQTYLRLNHKEAPQNYLNGKIVKAQLQKLS